MNTEKPLKIQRLVDGRHVRLAAKWQYEQWSQNEGMSYLEVLHEIQQTFVADSKYAYFMGILNGRPIAMASLIKSDLPTRPELSPWMANVFVAETERKKG